MCGAVMCDHSLSLCQVTSLEELDLVFRSAMQSGVVAAEEGEMITSVRNLDSKKIKARDCGVLSYHRVGICWYILE